MKGYCNDELGWLLTFGRVLETKVRDGSEQLGLEKEVTETCRVDADIGALLDGRSGVEMV